MQARANLLAEWLCADETVLRHLALSVRVQAPLITADERLVRLARGPFDVRSLAAVDPATL